MDRRVDVCVKVCVLLAAINRPENYIQHQGEKKVPFITCSRNPPPSPCLTLFPFLFLPSRPSLVPLSLSPTPTSRCLAFTQRLQPTQPIITMPSRDPPIPVQPHLSDDPLDAALRPPIDETEEEKALRLSIEEEARRISQEIDDSIREEKAQRKKSRAVRLLLLGQSESGTSFCQSSLSLSAPSIRH